jgi:Toxin SymE, type I toxin-antitoxin system
MRRSNVSFPTTTTSPPSRKLKVNYAYYGNGFNNNYPVIRIAGKYLRTFGFEIGSELRIDLEADKITIMKTATS